MGSVENTKETTVDEPDKKRIKVIITEKEAVQNSVTFDGSHFRKLIKGDHPIGAVRQLLAIIKATNNDKIIVEFLNSGGSALELVLVLDKLDSKTYHHHYQPVFSVLSLVIIKCRDEVPRLVPSTEEACRRLLRGHTATLHSMLAPSSTQVHKKAILEMLTGMVTLSAQLAREVLSTLSLREAAANDLAKHPVKYEPNSTRAHFTRFVLAYFYHDSTHLVKQLLDQRNLLQCIILAGLTADEAPLLTVFLRSLKEKIVENVTISKTTKLKMFNTKIMVKLLEAYTWTGPNVQAKKNSKKDDGHVVSEEEREEVLDCLHQLLLLICTNHKLGVAFVDPTIGLDQKKYNDLVYSVIKSMDVFWNISWVRDLAVKIVVACPDLVAPTFRHLGLQEFFQPGVSLSFVNTCEFAIQVVNSLVAERSLTKTGTADQLTHLTIRSVFNMNVMSCVRASLLSVHPTLRLLAVNLLNSCLLALQRFTDAIQARFSTDLKNFIDYKQRINDYITKNIVLEDQLMVAWSLGVGGDHSLLKVPTDTEYYLPLVDLLLIYNRVSPMYLPPVFISQLQTTSLDTISADTDQLFRIKILKFIIMFKNVQSSQPEFRDMIGTLVPLLSQWSEARSVLRSLFLQTGYFEGVESEVDVWVADLAAFPSCEHHLPLLQAVLKEVVDKPKRCIKILDDACSVSDSGGGEEFNWTQLIEVAKNPTKALKPWKKMLPNTRLSILVPALIRVLNSGTVENTCSCKFVSHLLGDILFSQVELGPYSQLIDSCSSPLVQPVRQYLSSLTDSASETHSTLSHQPFSKRSQQYCMLKTLSSSSFSDTQPLKLLGPIEQESVLQLLRLVVFHAVRPTRPDLPSRVCSVICALLSLTDGSPLRSACLQEVLLHPLVLKHFTPLQPPSTANLTPVLLSLMLLVGTEQQWLLEPYKERFLYHLKKTIRKKKKVQGCNLLEVCAKLVTEKEEVSALLSTIVEFQPELDEWEDVTTSLLQTAVSLKCALLEEVITVLSRHSPLHDPLADYLTVFPHLMAHLDTDHLTAKQEQLSRLCSMVVKWDMEGRVQKKLLKSNKKSAAVLFPALVAAGPNIDAALSRQVGQLVGSVCDELRSDPLPSWLVDNSNTIGVFLSQLSDDKCEAVYECLSSQPRWTLSHLLIARHVYLKLGRLVDFMLSALRMLVSLTNADTLPEVKLVCACLRGVVEEVDLQGHVWEPVRTCEAWAQWQRLALKLGETPDTGASFLLTTLAALCAVVYAQDPTGVSVVTEMVFSHSQFLTVMLAKPSHTKTALLGLLLSLLQLDSSVMASTHIPVFLSAYSASLSRADQLILQLLQLYEARGISLTEWRPFLWGEAAVSYYSVRSQACPGLWNRHNFTQLMDLFDEHRVHLTITNFPVNREITPKSEVEDQPEVYDPAFYLPMLVNMFAPSEVFFTYKTCQSGCLSLILSGLASHHRDMRMIAFVALHRFHCHLLSNTNNQDTLWLHFLDALRRGLQTDGDVALRLSSVVTVFLARTALVLTNPSHPLYLPLSQFVLAKPRFHLDTVPEMLPLFNSVHVQLHNAHQEWILSVLRDGLRDSQDFVLCLNSMVFKFIMEYFSSSLASDKAKLVILEILQAAVVTGGALLVSGYSLCPWLHTVARDPGLADSLRAPIETLVASLLVKGSQDTTVLERLIPVLN